MEDFINSLEATIKQRFNAASNESYVASLHAKGITKVAQKVGEEACEVVIASLAEVDQALVSEVADLYFHTLILLAERDLNFSSVIEELKRREGVSGLVEKANRTNK